MAFINARHDAAVRALLEAADGVEMERGAIVYPVALDLKLGAVSADLGRYLGADIARRHDAVTGNLFVGNPVFPVLGTAETPLLADPTPVQSFSHMDSAEQSAAIADPESPLRHFFDDTVAHARSARYLVVIPNPLLDDAFRKYVVVILGARLAKGSTPGLPVYELPVPLDHAVAAAPVLEERP